MNAMYTELVFSFQEECGQCWSTQTTYAYGTALKSFDSVTSPSHCQFLCNTESPLCKYWTWHMSGASKNRCDIKRDSAPIKREHNENDISGPKLCDPGYCRPCFKVQFEYSNVAAVNLVSIPEVDDPASCMDICLTHPGCYYWSWYMGGDKKNRCSLKNEMAVKESSVNANVISGPKNC